MAVAAALCATAAIAASSALLAVRVLHGAIGTSTVCTKQQYASVTALLCCNTCVPHNSSLLLLDPVGLLGRCSHAFLSTRTAAGASLLLARAACSVFHHWRC
jgi:hypothetical protein